MYTVGSLFAGIGGICTGFSQAGFCVKWANELDEKACQTYEHNKRLVEKDIEVINKDVLKFRPKLPEKKIDVLTAGFPCQPYSIAGGRKGLKDDRAVPMFKSITRIARALEPRLIFMENVPLLLTLNDGKVFRHYENMLKRSGYPYLWKDIYSTHEYGGVVQMRKRLYMVAFRDIKDYSLFVSNIEEKMKPIPITRTFNEIIDADTPVPEKYYYNEKKMKQFKRDVENVVTETGRFYQYRRNRTRCFKHNDPELCPTLTASMGVGGHNVPLIRDGTGIRKLTPKECILLQGFPEEFEFPETVGDATAYKQAGNSVSVPVIRRIALILKESLEAADSPSSPSS